MTKVKFIGDPNDNLSGPQVMIWKGETFFKNDWKEIPEALAKKAGTNNHFVVYGAPDPSAAIRKAAGGAPVDDLSSEREYISARKKQLDEEWRAFEAEKAKYASANSGKAQVDKARADVEARVKADDKAKN